MRLSRTLVALLVSLTLGLSLALSLDLPVGAHGGPAAVADPPGKADPRAERALQALAEVQALLAGTPLERTGHHGSAADAAGARDLTLALRDLLVLEEALPQALQGVAARILARPGEPGDDYITHPLPLTRCSATICVHYTEDGNHAPAGSDGDPATTPDYIRRVRNTVQRINDTYVASGYRRPKPDGDVGGGTDQVDIYIGDIGERGLYGYCTSDDPNDPDATGDYSIWAYCTLDDDYAANEFPTNTPLQNMRVTAAHEYFHAVQYAYDAYEDGWILESTATWAEDEVFDGINDNRQYLADSPLSRPARSLDRFGGLFHYGAWIWWRYLTEKYPARKGELPRLVLKVWRLLDGTPDGPNRYSTQGVAQVLRQKDTTLRRQLQLFSAANRHPQRAYDEGAAAAYRTAAPVAEVAVGPDNRDPGPVSATRDHLSSATVRFVPQRTDESDWRLRLELDLPPAARGGAAVVLVHERSGAVTTRVVKLDRAGSATRVVPFSTGAVRRVEVVLVNTSSRFRCWHGTAYSCQGEARDDDRRLTVDAQAFRR